ncbi:MAG: PolC-type DNA polymerase III [Oscillospiraceae bacterium]|jgi:DNA polymerase-3 subunit alpha (Gram-positive type)|nr:PolC-type DNA polymerase III [Oscillospiraceae bacterium]
MNKFSDFLNKILPENGFISGEIQSAVIKSLETNKLEKKISVGLIFENKISEDEIKKVEDELQKKLEINSFKISDLSNFKKKESSEFSEIEIRKDKFLIPQPIFENAEIIYGQKINGPVISIKDIVNAGNFCIWGDIFDFEERTTKIGLVNAVRITDYTNSITIKIYKKNSFTQLYEKIKNLKKGDSILVEGRILYEEFEKELIMSPRFINKIKKVKIIDCAPQKRVELHLHTCMSAMDGIPPIEKFLQRATDWGHTAMAITDHGVVQAFPDAANAVKKMQEIGKKFKLIYGIENYFVNDSENVNAAANDAEVNQLFICFDLETTGLNALNDRIIEIGAVKIKDKIVGEKFESFINNNIDIPTKITQLTGITKEMVCNAPGEREVIEKFVEFCGDSPILVAHNAVFDVSFLKSALARLNINFSFNMIDTIPLCRSQISVIKNYKLDTVASYFDLSDFEHHRACDDANILSMIFLKLIEHAQKKNNSNRIGDLFAENDVKKGISYHQTILVKDQVGLKNLYKLVSKSHLDYFYKRPRILKSELIKYRKGLLVGSACESGELFNAIVMGRSKQDLLKIAKFYDFLEIQPIGNNEFMVREGKISGGEEQLREFNRKVVSIGEELNIPVVATGDVHFLDPQDSEFRKVLMLFQGFKDGLNQAPLYLKTTAEMLKEFEYLGKEKAFEVVVTNTNKIADIIENVLPIPKGVYPPKIEGAEENLVKIAHENTHNTYGEVLPEIVKKRLEKELNSITKNNYSVLYMVAQKLVEKSEQEGYLVGSRGSVGSSFVATMAGISEVNPLPPHYVCKICKNSEFITDGSLGSGFDLPEKKCPKCENFYHRDGHNIPFETFLGFEGEKTPDIDLNFSGEYQARAHKYTEEIFGKKNVFKAGTISTIAQRSGLGFVKKAMEENDFKWNRAEQMRLALGCTGVRRTTGQHPGGMVIVPDGMEIYDFCPVQHPANDQNSDNITTHFDFHSIHDTICKLDELGHDVPTIYKYLGNYSGIPVTQVDMSDKKVMSLFRSTKELGISASAIDCKVGTLGLPEVGTFFVRQMLEEARPKTFADLIQISGLSHGTDVWNGNARELIKNGICTISEVIGTRDNIMTFLILKGVPKKYAFEITEIIRKGKASTNLTTEHINMMKECGVPDWYINSAIKIKYMFPKAHATAYMISALKLGWYKIHKPIEYYAAYFTVRGEDIEHKVAVMKQLDLYKYIKKIQEKGREATLREQISIPSLQLLNEAMARGIEFLPVDIYESEIKAFYISNGKIRLPLVSVAGLGETAAEGIVNARKKGRFISISDLRDRARITKAVIESLRGSGILNGMQESNQMSFF